MKKTILLFCVAATGLLLQQCASDEGKGDAGEQVKEEVALSDNPDSLCIVNPSWFPHSQTPAPAEGKGSPFDTPSTTNQIFHQWSWQKFLWLTKPDANGNPLFLDASQVKQVTTDMTPVTPPAGTLVALQDINQAGPGSPVLQTNAAYGGTSRTVYYSIHMNDMMYQNGLTFTEEIKTNKLPKSNVAMFPAGSFELKVAWVAIDAIPAAKLPNYYTTTASLSSDGGNTFTNVKVALIGMHVVGVVENHPEFIWATFEHEDLSPDYDWVANSATAAEDQLVFKKGSVSGIDGIRYNKATKLGVNPYQVFDLFQYGVPRNPDGSFMATSQKDEPVSNFNNVDGINKCVKAQLDDVWNNYFYNGSIWLNMDGKTPEEQAQLIKSLGSKIGSATPGSSVRGSTNCANITMESFTQTFQSDIKNINVNNLANCFSCHRGQSFEDTSFTSPIYVSHTFQEHLQKALGASDNKVEMLKSADEARTLDRLDD